MRLNIVYQKSLFSLMLIAAAVSCKSPNRTASRSGRAGSGMGGPTSGKPSEWVTPYNLVDINAATQEPTKVTLIGDIERITLDNPADVFTSGVIEMSGVRVVIPANLIIQMPVQRFTLQELFTQAPAPCKMVNQTGLALSDSCFFESRAAVATILANRTESGVIVAGDVEIAKAGEFVSGIVTYIDHKEGYVRVNGNAVAPSATVTKNNWKTTGVMIRINDPQARHSIQSGLGCASAASNCSPDIRFPVDSDNYTTAFITGYPACIPSTTVNGTKRPTGVSVNAITGSLTSTVSDARCPFTNRPANPAATAVVDSKYFAPIKVGDSLDATGNFEKINGVRFLSAHTVHVHVGLRTTPGKPDYLTFSETNWEVPGFPRARDRAFWIGFSTDPDSKFDLYRLAIDPNDGNEETRQHEIPIGSTIGNPTTANIGVPPFNNHIFRVRFKDDFLIGASGKLSPCIHMANAGLDGGCASGGTTNISENFRAMSPVTREAVARTRNKTANPGLVSFDVSGNVTPNGQYLAPVNMDHPDFVEVNLNQMQAPYIFTGEPWLLDRRNGPQGCGVANGRGACNTAAALDPFPSDGGLNPMTQSVTGINIPADAAPRVVMSYPYTTVDDGPLLPWQEKDVGNSLQINPSQPVTFSQCVAAP